MPTKKSRKTTIKTRDLKEQTELIAMKNPSGAQSARLISPAGFQVGTNALPKNLRVTGEVIMDNAGHPTIYTNKIYNVDGTLYWDGNPIAAGSGIAFRHIAVSGQTTVTAESSDDTLTLVGSGGVTITTNATSDTITIDATSAGNVSSSGTIDDNVVVRGDGGARGIQGSTVTIDDSGNIGIGTATPTQLLHLEGTGGSPAAALVKETGGSSVVLIAGGAVSYLHTPDGDPLIVNRYGGNIGIGNNLSPTHTLDVTGDINLSGNFSFDGSGNVVDSIKNENDMSSDSATALATQQSIKAYAQAANADITTESIQAIDSGGLLLKTDDGNARLTVRDDGNVGIGGGGSANAMLHVNGAVRCTDLNVAGVFSDSITTTAGKTTTFTRAGSATALDNDGSIPITDTTVNVETSTGEHKTGIRFAGPGDAGQIQIVQNTGDYNLTFDDSNSRIRGLNTSHNTLEPGSSTLFVSDGSTWNVIGGGKDTVATQNGLSPPS